MHRIPVRQMMQANVITVSPDDVIGDAAQVMEEFRIRRLPVVDDDDCLVGILTDSDVREAETADSVRSSYEPGVETKWLTVADVMTPDVVTISADATLGELAATLAEHKVGGVPVVEASERHPKRLRVVGIVTETDIFNLIASAWRAELEPRSRGD